MNSLEVEEAEESVDGVVVCSNANSLDVVEGVVAVVKNDFGVCAGEKPFSSFSMDW